MWQLGFKTLKNMRDDEKKVVTKQIRASSKIEYKFVGGSQMTGGRHQKQLKNGLRRSYPDVSTKKLDHCTNKKICVFANRLKL